MKKPILAPKAKTRSGINSGIDVLECVAASPRGLGLLEISKAVGMAKSSVMIAPLIANQMQAFQLGLGAASSFIVALVVMTDLGFSWRHLGLDLEQSE
jgi:hypothetical protein